MTMQPYYLAGVGVLAAIASWGLVGLLLRLAPRIGLLDQPNDRSLHTQVTPRGGGLGFVLVLALVLGAGLVFGLPSADGTPVGLRLSLAIYLGAALLVAAISLRDDFRPLGAGLRFLFQLGAAAAAVAGVAWFRQVALPGWMEFGLGGWGLALTVVWIVGLTNVYNFMDGINGIAGVQGVFAGLAWAVAGLMLGSPVVSLLGLLLAGGCLGFLFHNWSPARIFMGDVGSAFLGFSFAVLPLVLLRAVPPGSSVQAGTVPVFALLVVWPFVGDGFYTFLRRAWRRETVWKPHRSHLYQRLVRSGWSHARVSTLYAGWCGLSALAGVYWLSGAGGAAGATLVLPPASLVAMLLLVKHREKEVGSIL